MTLRHILYYSGQDLDTYCRGLSALLPLELVGRYATEIDSQPVIVLQTEEPLDEGTQAMILSVMEPCDHSFNVAQEKEEP